MYTGKYWVHPCLGSKYFGGRGAPISNGGYQPIVQPHFTVNCMKMEKNGPGAVRPKFYYVDPPSVAKIVKLLSTIYLLPLLQDISEDVLSVVVKIVNNFISEDS